MFGYDMRRKHLVPKQRNTSIMQTPCREITPVVLLSMVISSMADPISFNYTCCNLMLPRLLRKYRSLLSYG